jgi:hypothetical protein
MHTVHVVRLTRHSKGVQDAFAEAGVRLKPGARHVRIAEEDPRWAGVAPLVERFGLGDVVMAEFSEPELESSAFLRMGVDGEMGYPEPALDGSFRPATFDLNDYCRFCGVGQTQIAPFRIKKPPARDRSIMRLYWIPDECFVNVEVWRQVFEPLGIGRRSVVINKTGNVIDSVAQLQIPQVVDLDVDRTPYRECKYCGRKKYLSRVLCQGPCPEPLNADAPIFKSSQYFGDGALAFRLILVSRLMYGKIRAAGLDGAKFTPCKG